MRSHTTVLLFLSLLLCSCYNPKKNIAHEAKFKRSLQHWQEAKEKNGLDYEYSIQFSSVLGFGNITTITVAGGDIVSRKFEKTNLSNNSMKIETIYLETEAEINSHKEGAIALTLDELYSACEKDILTASLDENFIYFETKNDGILSLCSYFPKNCTENCYVGYNISSFKWL